MQDFFFNCRFIFLLFFGNLTIWVYAQNENSESLFFTTIEKSNLQFFLDDTFIFAGFNQSGIYYSNNFKNLSYVPGYNFGIEHYVPLKGKVFLSTGINFSQQNFFFNPGPLEMRVYNHHLQVLAQTAYELPVLQNLDFRIFFGAFGGVRTHSMVRDNLKNLPEGYIADFLYEPETFNRFDFGWNFGLSMEYRDFFFRFRSFSGFVKLDPKDQGMLNSFQFEIGYFLFRSINRKL